MGQTHDWVVIYFDDGFSKGQRTVVTETRGDLRGRRVVRGRESECRALYRSREEAAAVEKTVDVAAPPPETNHQVESLEPVPSS
jgi:hypothetical protein